jgi:hypothetical protein
MPAAGKLLWGPQESTRLDTGDSTVARDERGEPYFGLPILSLAFLFGRIQMEVETMVQTNLRLRENEREKLAALAHRLGVSHTDVVRLLLAGIALPKAATDILGSAPGQSCAQLGDSGR